jgi:uncharacterized membrane protein YeaQ/YmgE (transglycosylase-associated protein family)
LPPAFAADKGALDIIAVPCSNEQRNRSTTKHGEPWLATIQKEKKMNLIIYLIAGAVVGYIASMIMRTNSQQGLLLDIVVGVVGALLAGALLSPLLGVGTINDAITLPTLLVTLVGSVALLWIYKMVARRA